MAVRMETNIGADMATDMMTGMEIDMATAIARKAGSTAASAADVMVTSMSMAKGVTTILVGISGR